MRIQNVVIENFATLENIRVNFGEIMDEGNRVVLVEAINEKTGESNGVGKSAFFEAIFWCLTGKTLRGTVPPNPSVLVEVKKGKSNYIIKRTKNDIFLMIDGVDYKDLKSNVQKKIDEIIGTSYLAYQMLTYFSTDTIYKWFISFNDTERKDFFTEVIGLDFLDRVLEKVKEMLKSTELRMSEVQANIRENENLLLNITKNILPKLQEKQRVEQEILNYLASAGLEADINKLEFYKSKVESGRLKWKEKYLEKESEIRNLENEKRKNLSMVSSVSSLVICPTCFQQVPQEHKDRVKREVEEKVKEIDEKINNLRAELEEVRENYNQLENFYRDLSNMVVKYSSVKGVSDQTYMVESIQKRIDELKKKTEELTIQMERYKIMSDIFSPRGVKAGVIDRILEKISEMMYRYSMVLNLPVSMEIQKGKIGYTLDYKSLSSGQKRRLELAFLFALRTVLPAPFDYIVIDEIFDHLDYTGITMSNEIIKDFLRGFDILVFVVSHRRDIPVNYDKKFLFRMDNTGKVSLEVSNV
jgi:DNA repair exonuclease SbcCD ATPase subunit